MKEHATQRELRAGQARSTSALSIPSFIHQLKVCLGHFKKALGLAYRGAAHSARQYLHIYCLWCATSVTDIIYGLKGDKMGPSVPIFGLL
jgi:hypothetical protein